AFPYLVRVVWAEGHPLTCLVQSRDQRRTQVMTADHETGQVTVVREDRGDAWIEVTNGVPGWLEDGRLVSAVEDVDSDTRRLAFGDELVTPPGLHLDGVVHVGKDDVVFTGSDDPTETHVWRVGADGGPTRISEGPGVHAAAAGAEVVVLTSFTLDDD